MTKFKKKSTVYFTNEATEEKELGIILEDHDEYYLIISENNEYEEVPTESIIAKEEKSIFIEAWTEKGYGKGELKNILLNYD